jgi:hypothetical protein
MGLFRRRKDEFDYMQTNEIPVSTMLRWYIYDIGYGKDNIDEVLGLPYISPEGAEKEEQDSKERLDNLQPLVPFIDLMSDAAASIFLAVGSDIEPEMSEEEQDMVEEALGNLYKSIALSAIVGTLSVGYALGLLDVTAVTTTATRDIGDLFND